MNRSILAAWLLACSGGAFGAEPPIVIDGRFDDWRGVPYLHLDSPNDGTDAFDLCRVAATSRGTVVFLRFNIGRVLTLQSGPAEQGTLIVELETDAGRRLSVDLRGRSLWLDGDTGHRIGQAAVGLVTGPTHSGEEFELRVDAATLGVKPGDGVGVRFRGSDELDAAVRIVLDQPAVEAGRGTTERAPGTAIRVANLNVEHNGLTVPERRSAIGRLLRAAGADVYCIEEEWRTPAPDIERAFDEAFGAAPGTWRAVNAGGAAVITRLPVEFPATGLERIGVALVTTDTGRRVLIAGMHLKCCGYDASTEDRTRIEEVRSLAEVAALQESRGAGIVVAGDWNLVGSALPLRVLTAEDGLALRRQWPRHLNGIDAYTWRDAEKDFTPGILDVMAHSAGLAELRSFVFDTADLTDEHLASLGVERDDSAATDHLMIVSDYGLPSATP